MTDFGRGVLEPVRVLFEPLLLAKPRAGYGRKPCGDRMCLHALLYMLITGAGPAV